MIEFSAALALMLLFYMAGYWIGRVSELVTPQERARSTLAQHLWPLRDAFRIVRMIFGGGA